MIDHAFLSGLNLRYPQWVRVIPVYPQQWTGSAARLSTEKWDNHLIRAVLVPFTALTFHYLTIISSLWP